jgi:hypothetical protein
MGLAPIWLLLLVVLLGAALVFAGRRGVRISRTPICRDCHTDLPTADNPATKAPGTESRATDIPTGEAPATPTLPAGESPGTPKVCPSCGAALSRRGAVLRGRRLRLRPVELLGWALLAALAAGSAMVVRAALAGRDPLDLLPTPLLARHVAPGNANHAERAAFLLHARARRGKIDPQHWPAVVQAALARQADTATPWTDDWAGLLGLAHTTGVLSADDLARAATNAITVKARARDAASPGGVLPFVIEVDQVRAAPSLQAWFVFDLAHARIGRTPVHIGVVRPGDATALDVRDLSPSNEPAVDEFRLRRLGNISALDADRLPVGSTLLVPDDLPPGANTLELGLMVRVFYTSADEPTPAEPLSMTMNLSTPVRIDRSTAKPTPIKLTPEQLSGVMAALQTASISADTAAPAPPGSPSRVNLHVWLSNPPLSPPISADAWLYAGDRRIHLGPVASGRSLVPRFQQGWHVTYSAESISFRIETMLDDIATADLVLLPTPHHAMSTLDQTSYADQLIRVDRIPIRRVAHDQP